MLKLYIDDSDQLEFDLGFKLERFGLIIAECYQAGQLSDTAITLLTRMNSYMGKSYRAEASTIESTLNYLLANWKNYYDAKVPVADYFMGLCKRKYRSAISKKNRNLKQN